MGLSLLPLDFSFILPVVSRLLQLYSTDNKTSRLMLKRFSPIEGHPERFTELHEEEEREREIEMSRRRKRGTQEERDKSMQLSFPECSL